VTIERGNHYPGRDQRCTLPCGHDGGHRNNGYRAATFTPTDTSTDTETVDA
jgi:hypothetical protein